MNRGVVILFAALMVFCRAGAVSDDSLLRERQTCFDRFAAAYPEERVYLHFDNTSYFKGERIWYKAYVVRGSDLRATPLSRILYVELLNPMGYPVETQKLFIRNGQADGAFVLSDTINAGFYEVRAYTAWMLNFTTGDRHGWERLAGKDARRKYGERFQRYLEGNAGVFSRVFPVYEAVDSGRYAMKRMPRLPKATTPVDGETADRLLIDFYPEGGNFVKGVPARIAFQAHTAEGRTLNVAGALMRRGDSIGYFKTDYAGRGVFTASADGDSRDGLAHGLELKLTYGGRDYLFPLPEARRRGYALAVFTSPVGLRVSVARNADTEGMKLGLCVSCRGVTGYAGVVDLRDSLCETLSVDTALLSTGVNIVTLYTAEGKVIAQRMAFVNKHDVQAYHIETTLSADTAGLRPYAPVSIDCRVLTADGRPVNDSMTFSLAVTDDGSRDFTYADDNVLTYLLLSSELKGFVPHASYYFEADDAEHRAALDMLLMVQGWTRYDFERMMSGDEWKPMLKAERVLSFRGRLLDDRRSPERVLWRAPKKPLWVYSEIALGVDSFFCGEACTAADGTFEFSVPPFYGKGRMAMMLNKKSMKLIGSDKAGVPGHNYSYWSDVRPSYLYQKHIEPLNAYSPLPKDYDYYETAALSDPWDENVFRRGFMAKPERKGRFVYYDMMSGTYLVNNIVKHGHRSWSGFGKAKPVCVMDIDGLMTWLSNIYGDVSMFTMNPNKIRGLDGFPQSELLDDDYTFFMDITTYEEASAGKRHIMHFAPNSYNLPRLMPDAAGFRGYSSNILGKLLYVFGLDGRNRTLVNADSTGTMPKYRRIVGSRRFLPKGTEFFPNDLNFRQLRLYADVDNRRLIHQQGRYRETVIKSNSVSMSESLPLTSIFNFITDSLVENGKALPDFMGFRIDFQGFNPPVEFYSPDYSRMPLPEQTDYRRTVYWNPNVTTDTSGAATVTFYNNGFSRRLAVTAEGLTPEGEAISGR